MPNNRVYIRRRDIEWAQGWLINENIRTLFGYALMRNLSFEIDSEVLDLAEIYAVLRQTYSKHQIERLWEVEIIIH